MSDTNDTALVDVNAAARLCSLSRSAFYNLVNSGRAPRPIKLGRSARWRRQELLDWIVSGCPDIRQGKKGRAEE